MMYRVRIEVNLKPGHSDPEGEMTGQSLKELGYMVKDVSVSKVYEIYFDVSSNKEAEKQVKEMCMRLLANPTKDDYSFIIEETE